MSEKESKDNKRNEKEGKDPKKNLQPTPPSSGGFKIGGNKFNV